MPATRRLRPLLVALVIAPLLLVGLPAQAAEASGPQSAAKSVAKKRVTKVKKALRIAKNQRGDRYQYGAAGPNRFDCSGLVYFAAHRAGFKKVPRTSSAQGRFMKRIKRGAMRPGDFVFFRGGSGVYHVGFYAGRKNGRRMVLHSPGSGKRVRIDPVWTNKWFPGTLRRR